MFFIYKKTFWAYGVFPKRIINEQKNRKVLELNNCKVSKNPALFGIDLHIDDSDGVGIEAKKIGFKTLIISPHNKNWVETILQKTNQ